VAQKIGKIASEVGVGKPEEVSLRHRGHWERIARVRTSLSEKTGGLPGPCRVVEQRFFLNQSSTNV
jgi:hypothetical protein